MYLNKCNLCPHMCLVDRENKKRGFCKSGENVKIALSSKFFYEEPCISGTKGSGAVFFSNCNLNKLINLLGIFNNFYKFKT